MTEKEAIERLYNFKSISILYGNTYTMHIEQLKQLQEDLGTLLQTLKYRDKINKAIDKLKEDIKNNIKKAGSYVRDESTVEQERAIAKFEEANEILKILE